MKNRVFSAAVLLAAFGLLFTGCDSGPDAGGGDGTSQNGEDNGGSNLSGSITIEGSSTVEPISTKAGEEFNNEYPGVNVAVSGQGTGNGGYAHGGSVQFTVQVRQYQTNGFGSTGGGWDDVGRSGAGTAQVTVRRIL